MRIRVREKKKVLPMGICILYNHKIKYNYICGRHGKGLY